MEDVTEDSKENMTLTIEETTESFSGNLNLTFIFCVDVERIKFLR